MLTDEDMEQGRIYAKLLDPVAPFVVVTNGTTTKIFDTLTKEDLTKKPLSESRHVKNNFVIDLDSETRQQALLCFFTLNYENLLSFCTKQSTDTISRLLNADGSYVLKNYIPEVFVKRNALNIAIHEFLQGDDSCFLISGKSGTGKTSVMCDLVEEIRSQFPVLFYNCGEINENLENEIADDFNWEFSTNKSPQHLISQIDNICKQHNQKLIIFLDAIDEWNLDLRSIILSKFVGHIKDKKIKLIASCKDSQLRGFLTINGAVSVLSQNLYFVNKSKNMKFFNLAEFSFNEMTEACEKYSKHFSLSGFDTTSQTFYACRDPVMLRVVAEIYRQKTVPTSLNSPQIYEKYLEMVCSKKPELNMLIRRTLRYILQQMVAEKSEYINESSLNQLEQKSFYFLVDCGVLSYKKNIWGQHTISFLFDGLRNYFLIYHVLELHLETDLEKIRRFIALHIESTLGRGLFIWYKETAERPQLEILQKQIEISDKKFITRYLHKFISRTEFDFPFIKTRLFPNKKLGLLVLYNQTRNFINAFGFRQREFNESEIIWMCSQPHTWTDPKITHSLMQQYNVIQLTSLSVNFTDFPVDDFTEREVFRTVKEIVTRCLLDEHNNVSISSEKFFASLRHWGDSLGLATTYDTESSVLPLSLAEIKEKMDLLFPDSIKTNQYNTKIETSHLSVLWESLENLLQNTDTITSIALPCCDEPNNKTNRVKPSEEYFSKKGLVDYVTEFFKKFVEEYKNIIETNFPTLKEKFPTYQKLPFFVAARLQKSKQSSKADGLMYAICKNNREQNEFEIRDYDAEPFHVGHDELNGGFYIKTKNGTLLMNRYCAGKRLFSLFHPPTSQFSDCPLTSFVYRVIEDDLNRVLGSKFKDIDDFFD